MMYRLQGWLAERFRFVQFPPERRPAVARVPLFKNAMPWELRLLLIVAGVAALAVAAVAMVLAGVLLWAIVTA